MATKQKQKYYLACIAHPDDETIFFAGLIQRLKKFPWRVICLTDANADGNGLKRKKDFARACKALQVQSFEWWAYPDIFENRLPVEEISARLNALSHPQAIFTHGPLGEYGHPHHQDTCFAVHQAFEGHANLYSVAYNTFPEFRIDLSAQEYQLKLKILTEIYGSETQRFLNMLPATHSEGFLRFEPEEVSAIYKFLSDKNLKKLPQKKNLKNHQHLLELMLKIKKAARPF